MKNNSNILFNKIIDLNILPKDNKVTEKSIKSLYKKMYKNGLGKCMFSQLKPSIYSESNLTLLNSIDSEKKVLHSIAGIHNNKLTEIASLSENISAIYIKSDMNKNLLVRVFEYASMKNKPIICKIQNIDINGDGLITDTENSFFFGLQTRNPIAERVEVASILEYVKHFNVSTLFQGVTDKKAFELINSAREESDNIYVEISIHHLIFDDLIYSEFNNYSKIDPPFQSKEGKENMLNLLKSEKIDMLTSLHSEISESEKSGSFNDSKYGVIGLDSILPIYYSTLVKSEIISMEYLEKLTSINQAKFLGIEISEKLQFNIEETSKVEDKNSLYFGKVFYGKIES